ncbi:MAG: 2-amino-4-hydroxy-6-hydroxymethyldihydropteridine diphosphokinase [Ardenticatenaceae bacterium]|nr:2-amino-4-hydroxy-6-hydroxymethyldihydropteridine diphosphokinase [Ardenticatenaceae bacterium]
MTHKSETHYQYMIGIGSNINPAENVSRGLKTLQDLSSRLVVSRIVQTAPVGMISDHTFYNLVVFMQTVFDAVDLKKRFNAIEESFGRDRSDPQSAVKDRPLDLDILVDVGSEISWPAAIEEADSYYRPLLAELVAFLSGQPLDTSPEEDQIGFIEFDGEKMGDTPREIANS